MDDLLTGTHTVQQAQNLIHDITAILSSASFKLRKWISNCPEVFTNMNEHDLHPNLLHFCKNDLSKTLGLMWSYFYDSFIYKISNLNSNSTVTKRTILSEMSKLFDPLGLVSPCIIIPKTLMQQLWLHKLEWDDDVPPELAKR